MDQIGQLVLQLPPHRRARPDPVLGHVHHRLRGKRPRSHARRPAAARTAAFSAAASLILNAGSRGTRPRDRRPPLPDWVEGMMIPSRPPSQLDAVTRLYPDRARSAPSRPLGAYLATRRSPSLLT